MNCKLSVASSGLHVLLVSESEQMLNNADCLLYSNKCWVEISNRLQGSVSKKFSTNQLTGSDADSIAGFWLVECVSSDNKLHSNINVLGLLRVIMAGWFFSFPLW